MADFKTGNHAVSGESLDTIPAALASSEKRPMNRYAFACAVLASLTLLLPGYDIGVMSGAIIFIKKDLKINDLKLEILTGILNVYSLIGSAAAGRTSDWIGRRYTLVFAAGIFFIGALMMGLAPNYACLMAGRFVAGVGVGYCCVSLVYIAEISPALSRGFLTSFPEVFINLGILLGYVSNYGFSKFPQHLSWRLMLGIGAIPSVLLGICVLLTMPESPRWLVVQGRIGEARQVLEKVSSSKEEAEARLTDIKASAEIPEESRNGEDDVIHVKKRRNHGEGVWKELLVHPTPSVRRVLIAALGTHFFQQASGIDAVVLYSPRIFEKAGIKKNNDLLLATIAVGCMKTLFILIATFLFDRIGRRKLLLSSVSGMIASVFCLGIALTVIDHSDEKLMWAVVLSVSMLLAYVASFSIGLGPIASVYTPEIFPLRLRAQGVSLCVAVNRVTSGLISMTFISLYKGITIGGSFFLFGGIATVAWLFFYTFLPETQGRTLEEMEVLFDNFRWRESMRKKTVVDRVNTNISPAGNSGAVQLMETNVRVTVN